MSENLISTAAPKETLLQKEYAKRDFNRPPFRFPTRDGSFEKDHNPQYPQISEWELFEMEYRVFAVEEFPAPPNHFEETHPVRVAYARLCQARNALDRSIQKVHSREPLAMSLEKIYEIQATTTTVRRAVGLDEKNLDPETTKAHLTTLGKEAREWHLSRKKLYFHAALRYLHLYKNCPETENSQETNDLLDETEAVFLVHMAYTVVRSAIHEIGAERKNGELVVDHVYAVCLQGINRYRKLLSGCQNPIQRHWFYREMKLDIIRSLCHDYLEDFHMLSATFLVNKLIQHTLFETKVEVAIQTPAYRRTPQDTNFCSANKGRIVKELRALIKPPRGKREGYIRKQIAKGLSKKSRIPTLLTKLSDRLHNLNTLDSAEIHPASQANKVIETAKELIPVCIEVHEDPKFKGNQLRTTLLAETLIAAETALREGIRLITAEQAMQAAGEIGCLEEAGMDDLLQKALQQLQAQIQFLRSKKAT